MSNTDAYWDPDESQSLLGDFEGTVVKSFWSTIRIVSQGKVDGQGADDLQLYWLVRVDEVYQPWEKVVPESVQVNFGIGKGWQADEAGVWAEHEDDPDEALIESGEGRPQSFRGSSLYGKFLGLCGGKYNDYYTETNVDPMVAPVRVLDDGDGVIYGLSAVRSVMAHEKANPRNASVWVGKRFRFRGLGLTYKQTKGTPGFKVLPVAYLGSDGEVSIDATTPGTSFSGPGAPEAVHTDLTLIAGTLPATAPDTLINDLGRLVDTSSSHTEFMKNALKLADVKSDKEIKAAVMSSGEGPWSVRGRDLDQEEADRENNGEVETPAEEADSETVS